MKSSDRKWRRLCALKSQFPRQKQHNFELIFVFAQFMTHKLSLLCACVYVCVCDCVSVFAAMSGLFFTFTVCREREH